MRRLLLLSLWASLAPLGCAKDKCATEVPSFQLDVAVRDMSLASRTATLRVDIYVNGAGRTRDIPLGEALRDGATALAIVIDPPPADFFDLDVRATALDVDDRPLATARGPLRAAPNGCNRVSLELTLKDLPDAGPQPDAETPDTGDDAGVAPDATPPDVESDASVVDTGEQPDAGALPDAGDLPDSGVPPDSGDLPDSGVLPDSGDLPDGGFAPDSNGTAFSYTPTNFDPRQFTPLVGATFDCGNTSFDSTNLTFNNFCGGVRPVPVLTTSMNRPVVVIPVTRLELGAGSRFRVFGQNPVILAVYGLAQLEGTIDASGIGSSSGAGGGSGADCAGSSGQDAPSGSHGGGGGGGYQGAGASGGQGADSSSGGTPGASVTPAASPLRGGCRGGAGRAGGFSGGEGGGAGGGIQISISRDLDMPSRGSVLAGGGGGRAGQRRGGGGGGGSGGTIIIEAVHLQSTGTIVANGGAGGGGGAENASVNGGGGQDGVRANPQGGYGGLGEGGAGGTGGNGASSPNDGLNGDTGSAGGGGGGGGRGAIFLRGTIQCTATGSVSPPVANCP